MMKILTFAVVIALMPLSACSGEFDDVVTQVIQMDERNTGIEIDLARKGSSLEFDLAGMASDNSPADVFRVLLQTAQALQDESFDEVILAYQGDPRFILPGDDFQVMGAEFETQNPVYTIRTFPEKLIRPSGEAAFPTRSGGLIYLMRAQMEDFSAFNEEWYLNDLVADLKQDEPEIVYADDEAL